jgi:HPt (histidine-containing phosphotransfer) domain-containing protein
MDDILLKPFKKPDVQAMLNKWINSGSSEVPAAAPAPGEDIFNSAELMDTFMGNEEMAFSLLERFIERTSGQIKNIPALKAAADWESARREAHTIKGAALTLSGRELGKAAARLERAFKDACLPEAEAAYPQLEEAFARFKEKACPFLRSEALKIPSELQGSK